MELKNFKDFVNESTDDLNSELFKVYITRGNVDTFGMYSNYAKDNFFNFIESNEQTIINQRFPLLNYDNKITKELIEDMKFPVENIYNLPENTAIVADKKLFHEKLKGDKNLPVTVFTKEDAKTLKFPIIAKPGKNHSGIGIQVFKNKKELHESNDDFDVFSEKIDIQFEHRFIMFKNVCALWMKRIPLNEKAKNLIGETSEPMEFRYIKQDHEYIPKEYRNLLGKFVEQFSNIEVAAYDVVKDSKNKLYLIEVNSQPGLPFDGMSRIYQLMYEDFYKEGLSEIIKERFNIFSNDLNIMTIRSDTNRFSIES